MCCVPRFALSLVDTIVASTSHCVTSIHQRERLGLLPPALVKTEHGVQHVFPRLTCAWLPAVAFFVPTTAVPFSVFIVSPVVVGVVIIPGVAVVGVLVVEAVLGDDASPGLVVNQEVLQGTPDKSRKVPAFHGTWQNFRLHLYR